MRNFSLLVAICWLVLRLLPLAAFFLLTTSPNSGELLRSPLTPKPPVASQDPAGIFLFVPCVMVQPIKAHTPSSFLDLQTLFHTLAARSPASSLLHNSDFTVLARSPSWTPNLILSFPQTWLPLSIVLPPNPHNAPLFRLCCPCKAYTWTQMSSSGAPCSQLVLFSTDLLFACPGLLPVLLVRCHSSFLPNPPKSSRAPKLHLPSFLLSNLIMGLINVLELCCRTFFRLFACGLSLFVQNDLLIRQNRYCQFPRGQNDKMGDVLASVIPGNDSGNGNGSGSGSGYGTPGENPEFENCLCRGLGPWGPDLVRRYTSFRFGPHSTGDMLNEDESKLLSDYIYHTLAAKASGELCLKYIFAFGAFARSPLLKSAPEWRVPTTFIYGYHDWMDFEGAKEARKHMNVPVEIIRVPQAGHFVFLDNAMAFHSAVIYACRKFLGQDDANEHIPEGKLSAVEMVFRTSDSPCDMCKWM
eukprot:Gb_30725 [translate_table: standard]